MRAQEVGRILSHYPLPIRDEAGRAWTRLADDLIRAGQVTVADVLKKKSCAALNATAASDVSADVGAHLKTLSELLVDAGAKKPLTADVKRLMEYLEASRESPLQLKSDVASSATAATRRPTLANAVEDYLCRLEAALGDEVLFEEVFRKLRDDRNIRQADAVEIASRFFTKTGQSTSRPKALQLVRQRHDALLESRRRANSISGQAA